MTTADDQIEYLPLFVYGTLLEGRTRDCVLGQSVLRTERAAAQGRWEEATDYPAASFRDPVSQSRSWCAASAARRSAPLTWPEWMGSDAATYPSGRTR